MISKKQSIPYRELTTANIIALTEVVKGEVVINIDTGLRMTYSGTSWLSEISLGSGKFGDISGGNYTEFEADGTLVFHGDATVYDDMLNNASSFLIEGDRPPTMKYFANDGVVGTEPARSFNGIDDYGELAQPVINPAHFSFNVWLKPDDLEGQIMYIPDFLDFYFSGGRPIADWSGLATQQSNLLLSQNAWSMITLTAQDTGTAVNLKMYINGVLHKEVDRSGNLDTASGVILVGKYTSGWFNKSVYDEMCAWSITLSQDNINDLYRNGDGNGTSIPVGNTLQGSVIVEATDVMCYFKFNEASGQTAVNECTLGAGRDMALYGTTVTTGVIGAGSKGVALPHWSGVVTNEVNLIAQTSHSRKALSDFLQHLHVVKTVDAPGYPIYKLEYLAVGLTKDLGNTITIQSKPVTIYDNTTNTNLFKQHTLAEFWDAIDGSNLGISSSFIARLYRDVKWETDNNGLTVDDGDGGTYTYISYPHDVILLASDAHIEIDSGGSRTPYGK